MSCNCGTNISNSDNCSEKCNKSYGCRITQTITINNSVKVNKRYENSIKDKLRCIPYCCNCCGTPPASCIPLITVTDQEPDPAFPVSRSEELNEQGDFSEFVSSAYLYQ
jgi:hypothetical protein